MKFNITPQLIEGTPVGISIYSVTKEAPHHHEGFMEIIYCFKGSVSIYNRFQRTNLSEGDIVSCDPTDIHYMNSDEENLLVSFYFDLRNPVLGKPDLEHIYFVCEPLAVPEAKQPELQNMKRLLLTMLYFYCFPHPSLSKEDIITRFAVNVIRMMLDHFHYFYFLTNYMEYTEEMKERFESIMIYVDKNYTKKITLEKLCDINHFNYKYLSRFFKQTSLVGFPKYVNDIRSYKAACILMETNKNISDIAYETGFSAPMYYYQTSKLWSGMTPNQFRKHFTRITEQSDENVYFDALSKKNELEHLISFRFAELQVPELWLSPFIPYKGLPIEQKEPATD